MHRVSLCSATSKRIESLSQCSVGVRGHALCHCSEYDPEEHTSKAHDQPNCAQDHREVLVLPHSLQITGGLVVLRVYRDKDGGYGAEKARPTDTPEHDARGYDGVEEPVVVGTVVASVHGRVHDLWLLLYHHHVAGSGGSLSGRRLVVRRRPACVSLLRWRVCLLWRVPLLRWVGRIAALLGRVGGSLVYHLSFRSSLDFFLSLESSLSVNAGCVSFRCVVRAT